jgi:hypothetical protein
VIDAATSAGFSDHNAVNTFVCGHLNPLRSWVLETFSDAEVDDVAISTDDRGALPLSLLLASQRWHAALHLRQVMVFLDGASVPRPDLTCFAAMPDLRLPDDPF